MYRSTLGVAKTGRRFAGLGCHGRGFYPAFRGYVPPKYLAGAFIGFGTFLAISSAFAAPTASLILKARDTTFRASSPASFHIPNSPFFDAQHLAKVASMKPETSSEKSKMSDLTWASDTLRNQVAPVGSAQQVKARIRTAARALGWEYERAKSIWYADERVAMRPRELRDIERYTGLQYGRQELSELDALIGRADALLVGSQDKDFYRSFADALRAMASLVDRARTPGGDQ